MFCDGDCTYAMCGDGYHNMLVGGSATTATG